MHASHDCTVSERRHRHLMLDLGQLLPTAKRDAKLDTKSDRAVINEAAELKVGHTVTACWAWVVKYHGRE